MATRCSHECACSLTRSCRPQANHCFITHCSLRCAGAGYAIGSGPFKTDTRTDVKLVLSFGWQNAVLFAQMVVNVVSVTAAAALMYPAMASDNGIPLWPWIAPAYFTGVLPLLAYITAWQPKPRMRLPPTASQMVSQSAVVHHYIRGLLATSSSGCITHTHGCGGSRS